MQIAEVVSPVCVFFCVLWALPDMNKDNDDYTAIVFLCNR